MKKLISIVAPMYNEQELVEEYCETTLMSLQPLKENYIFEILLVNDGSKDNTLFYMHKMQEKYPCEITIINLSRNFGLEGAVNAGLKKAAGHAVVVMDADLQDPPSLIVQMVQKWESGADIVVASREKRTNDSFFKKLTANMFYKVLNSLSGKLTLEKNAANYRLLSRKAVDEIMSLAEVNGVFRVVVPFIGMKTDTVTYDRNKRFAGETKYNLKSMIRYASDSLTGISIEPLRKIIWSIPIAGLMVIISLIGIIAGNGPWKIGFTITLFISFLFGILFICIGLIGEYIAQIMVEVKGRPTSIIYEYKPCTNIERKDTDELRTNG